MIEWGRRERRKYLVGGRVDEDVVGLHVSVMPFEW
jgi:hypothetical protein